MTATQYAAKVTEIIDEQTGGNFEYPESFDSDCETYMKNRVSPAEAATVVRGCVEQEQREANRFSPVPDMAE